MADIINLEEYRNTTQETGELLSDQSNPELASVAQLHEAKTGRVKTAQEIVAEQLKRAEERALGGIHRTIFDSGKLLDERFDIHNVLFEYPMPLDKAHASSMASRIEGQNMYFDTYANLFRVSEDEPIAKLGVLQLSHVRAFCESSILRWISNLRDEGLASKRLLDGVSDDATSKDYSDWRKSIAPSARQLNKSIGRPSNNANQLLDRARSITMSDYFEKIQPRRYAARVAVDAVIDMSMRGEGFVRDLYFDGTAEELNVEMTQAEQRSALHNITSETAPMSRANLLNELGRLSMYQSDVDVLSVEQALFAQPKRSNVHSLNQQPFS